MDRIDSRGSFKPFPSQVLRYFGDDCDGECVLFESKRANREAYLDPSKIGRKMQV